MWSAKGDLELHYCCGLGRSTVGTYIMLCRREIFLKLLKDGKNDLRITNRRSREVVSSETTRGTQSRAWKEADHMLGILFRAKVKPGQRRAFIDFFKWDVGVARACEPGTIRFDVYEDAADKNAFFVYEAYRDRRAFRRHKNNAPFKKWERIVRRKMVDEFWSVLRGDTVCSLIDSGVGVGTVQTKRLPGRSGASVVKGRFRSRQK